MRRKKKGVRLFANLALLLGLVGVGYWGYVSDFYIRVTVASFVAFSGLLWMAWLIAKN